MVQFLVHGGNRRPRRRGAQRLLQTRHRTRGPAAISVNKLGFDEREFPLQKAPGVYRIVILGDSPAVSAPRLRRIGDVVAELLNARSPSAAVTYESVSFGKVGVDTPEEVEIGPEPDVPGRQPCRTLCRLRYGHPR